MKKTEGFKKPVSCLPVGGKGPPARGRRIFQYLGSRRLAKPKKSYKPNGGLKKLFCLWGGGGGGVFGGVFWGEGEKIQYTVVCLGETSQAGGGNAGPNLMGERHRTAGEQGGEIIPVVRKIYRRE